MTGISDRYRRVAGQFGETADAVAAAKWSDPSPCEGWAARDVVQHVVRNAGWFLGFIDRDLGGAPSVDDDPAAAFAAAREAIQGALDDPATAETTVDAFGGPMTFQDAVDRFMCMDLVVHRWDLAAATGQEVQLDPAEIESVTQVAKGFGDALRSANVCGPELEPPAGADEQTRMLAFMGRKAWA